MQIGSGFMKTSKNGKQYISIAFDKGALALIPILNNIRLTLWFVKPEDRKSDKSPQWSLSLSEPMEKEDKTDKKDEEEQLLEECGLISQDEIPM